MKVFWLPHVWQYFCVIFLLWSCLFAGLGWLWKGREAAFGTVFGSLVGLSYLLFLAIFSGQWGERQKFRWWHCFGPFRMLFTLIFLGIGFKLSFLSPVWVLIGFFLFYPMLFFYHGWEKRFLIKRLDGGE